MRRTVLAVAVMITLVGLAPAVGAQCNPSCEEGLDRTIQRVSPDDGPSDPSDGPIRVAVPTTGAAGPVLP